MKIRDEQGRTIHFPEAGDFVRFELPDGRFLELAWRGELVSVYAFPEPLTIRPTMSSGAEITLTPGDEVT